MRESIMEAQDFLMNTTVEQKIMGCLPGTIYDAAIKKLNILEDMMSFYRDSSEVSLINHSAGEAPVRISEEMMLVLTRSQEMALLSQNAFSIMLAPLVQLWRKSGNNNKLPSNNCIKEELVLCGVENLKLDSIKKTAYLKKKGCMIDLGGIGKGLAADICCEIYKDMGASSAFINLGGNVKVIGNRPDHKPWVIGLQHPDQARGTCYGAIMCSDLSVVTSGAYERYQEINGKRYHHIIDGKTGYPSETDLKSVTILSKCSLQADALSKAAFVLGLEKGSELMNDSECVGAVFFTTDNKVFITDGIKECFKLLVELPYYKIENK